MKPKELWAWREKMGYTQPEAAMAIGISFRAYQNYEGGERDIPEPVELATKYLEEHPRISDVRSKRELVE